MRKLLIAVAVAAALGAAGPAAADEPARTDREQMEELARQGMTRIVQALELLLRAIPQYEMPEVTEDGDIIIRRRRLPDEDAADETTVFEET